MNIEQRDSFGKLAKLNYSYQCTQAYHQKMVHNVFAHLTALRKNIKKSTT